MRSYLRVWGGRSSNMRKEIEDTLACKAANTPENTMWFFHIIMDHWWSHSTHHTTVIPVPRMSSTSIVGNNYTLTPMIKHWVFMCFTLWNVSWFLVACLANKRQMIDPIGLGFRVPALGRSDKYLCSHIIYSHVIFVERIMKLEDIFNHIPHTN